jgi:Papain-like cysteine protease AvrRpt2
MRPNSFRRLFVVVCLFAASLIPGSSRAEFMMPQAPSPVALNVPILIQNTDMWCWLASAEMVIQYRRPGISYAQCRIMEMGYGLPPGACCTNVNMCRKIGDWPEIRAVLENFGGISSDVTGPLDADTLYVTLSNGHPVIAKIGTGMAVMHAVVIRGMRFQPVMFLDPFGRPYREWVPFVLINDPASYLPREAPFSQLASVWLESLIAN